ncbi:MAG: aminoglycoside phosphotransferase family protein, partial [Actinomycetota bacterium]
IIKLNSSTLMKKNFVENLPPKFRQNITGLYGAKGDQWLAKLPETVAEIAGKWSLKIGPAFSNLSYNFVAQCVDETGEKYVLKVGVPEADSPVLFEKRALEAFAGKGAVKVIKFDKARCAMLLERAIEGKTLSEACGEDYEKATEIAIEVMGKLPRNSLDKNEFINLETWISGLKRAVKAGFAPEKVTKAQRFFAELSEPFEKKILLHGDIHFDNILSARREPFLVIDPKGVVGEIGYEIAVFLNDLAGWTAHLANRKKILDSAVEKFSKTFAVNSKELRQWTFAFAVLSAWWIVEDFGGNYQRELALADIWDV